MSTVPQEKEVVVEPMPVEEGWERQAAPELYKFQKPGDTVSGMLASVSEVEMLDKVSGEVKPVVQYIIVVNANKVWKLHGTYDLVQKLKAQHRGREVRIRYLGEDPNVRKGNNNLKLFDVLVKKSLRTEGPEITDVDIPF